MKLTPNERTVINSKALAKLISAGKLSFKEAFFYTLIRDGAFLNSKGQRQLSMVQIHHLVNELGFQERNTKRTLKKLVDLKMLEPNYFIIVKDDEGKSVLTPVSGFKNFQGEGSLGTRTIKFVKYKVLDVKHEKLLRKQARNKKKKPKKT